ncbi:MAG: tetratricopeptide repeat protein [Deltaproteobacteria bacterium]|nr:tetratricopeptide repeat protein [Deltaproteobacteria bacterium]
MGKKLFFLLLLLSLSTQMAHAAAEAPISFSKGIVVFSDGKYNKALPLFENAYKINPSNPDHIYLLAITHFKLNHYSEANKYFKELLDKHPEYTQAYPDYGMSLFRQKQYSEAAIWLAKAVEANKKDPSPLFYLGLSKYYAGQKEESKATLKKVKDLYPQSELAETSMQWLDNINAGTISETQYGEGSLLVGKKWNIRAATSFFYDSNVTFDPDDEDLADFSSNQDDIMGTASLDISYLVFQKEAVKWFVQYSGYQSAYANINVDDNRFNYGRHIGASNVIYKFSDEAQLRLPMSYTLVTLGAARYSQTGEGSPMLDYAWGKNWMTTFYGDIRRDDFFAAPSTPQQDRDATRPAGGLEQYYFFQNRDRYLKLGYEYARNYSVGNDWDYYSHRIMFLLNSPLPWKLNISALADIIPLRKFFHQDSIYGVTRSDFSVVGGGVLSREIIPHMTLACSYTYALNDSNIPHYTYKRQLVGFTVSTQF